MVSTVSGLVMSEEQEHSLPALVAAFPCSASGLCCWALLTGLNV